MTEQEIMDTAEQRIRDRFNRVTLRGGGSVGVGGKHGKFAVSLTQPPPKSSEPKDVDPDIGLTPFHVFKAEFNAGLSVLRINYGGAINDVPWTYGGAPLSNLPHPAIEIGLGIRVYGVVTFATSNVSLHTRSDPSGPTGHWLGGTVCSSAEMVVRGYSDPFPADTGNPSDAESPGSFSMHWLFARYNGAGDEVPPDHGDPDHDRYGWLALYPFAPFGLIKMNALAFNP